MSATSIRAKQPKFRALQDRPDKTEDLIVLKRLWVYIAILLGLVVVVFAYSRLEEWKFRRKAWSEFGPILAEEQEQKDALLALGNVDLNPPDLTLADLEQKIHRPGLKLSGDFNTTRLGWACGKERCSIWATFLVPFGQDIPSNVKPAGLIIRSPSLAEFSNIRIREIHLGESDRRLVELSQNYRSDSHKLYHRISWDKDWEAAWGGINNRVFVLVFSNENQLLRYAKDRQPATATAPK
jgi:hypothetical protein